MTGYATANIPPSCRTQLERLAIWVLWSLYYLYPNQRYKEDPERDPVLAVQLTSYKSPSENDKNFITFRITVPMQTNWELLTGKPWAFAEAYPNFVTTLPAVLTSD
jgi:hypothetical protein